MRKKFLCQIEVLLELQENTIVYKWQRDMLKSPSANEQFGASGGVVSWGTSQDFGSSPPVRAFAKPRPTPNPRHVACKSSDCIVPKYVDSNFNKKLSIMELEKEVLFGMSQSEVNDLLKKTSKFEVSNLTNHMYEPRDGTIFHYKFEEDFNINYGKEKLETIDITTFYEYIFFFDYCFCF